MSKPIILRDRPDPILPTVYEEVLVDSFNKFNINSSGYISIGYVTGWNVGIGALTPLPVFSGVNGSGWGFDYGR